MDIDFVLDTVCIWSYIGFRRLTEALQSFPNDAFALTVHPYFITPPDDFLPKIKLGTPRTPSLRQTGRGCGSA